MLPRLETNAWDRTKAAHLLNRAGFGGSPAEIEALAQIGFDGAIHQLLEAPSEDDAFPPPSDIQPMDMREMLRKRREIQELTPEQKTAARQEFQKMVAQHRRQAVLEMIPWWVDRMVRTSNPLREKLTLFWHGHFATSIEKVKQPYLMLHQNLTLRREALGNFGTLTKAISRDPAMMVYLDTNQSNREHPNENFARELMELFTLGEGNYSEGDIREAARAFTGYRINLADQSFRFAPFQHDDREKTFFGKTQRFDGDDIIDVILEQPQCARFIARKLWIFFAYENPEPEIIDALATTFRENHYSIQPVIDEMFRSAAFYSAKAIRSQIKSPIQWLVQGARQLEIHLPTGPALPGALRQLGQIPFMPPSVKGWDGGKAWISTSSLLQRYNMASYLAGAAPMKLEMFRKNANAGMNREVENPFAPDLAKLIPEPIRKDPQALVANLSQRLFQTELGQGENQKFYQYLQEHDDGPSDKTLRGLLHLMMSTPHYQLC